MVAPKGSKNKPVTDEDIELIFMEEAFAFEAKIHRTYISDLERAVIATITIVEKLAKALGAKPGKLLE